MFKLLDIMAFIHNVDTIASRENTYESKSLKIDFERFITENCQEEPTLGDNPIEDLAKAVKL